jgi:hypothetical protein
MSVKQEQDRVGILANEKVLSVDLAAETCVRLRIRLEDMRPTYQNNMTPKPIEKMKTEQIHKMVERRILM